MFKIWYPSFGYFCQDSFDDLDSALLHAKKICFSARIYNGDICYGKFDPIGGITKWENGEPFSTFNLIENGME